ncbi:MAG: CBU_0592 family membrane protein [Mucilaginibacter sp.]
MKVSDILASIGVVILLIAFLLNLYKKLPAQSKAYSLMNFIGAAICCLSSYLIRFYPFVILEGVWGAVALLSLFNVPRGTSVEIKNEEPLSN